jgi:hypothetical protein
MTEPTTPPPGGQAGWTPPGGQAPDQAGWAAPAGTPPPPAATPAPTSGDWQQGWERHRHEGRSGAIIGGLILVSLGAIFLLDEFVPGFEIGRLWPLILVAIGVALLVGAFFRRA